MDSHILDNGNTSSSFSTDGIETAKPYTIDREINPDSVLPDTAEKSRFKQVISFIFGHYTRSGQKNRKIVDQLLKSVKDADEFMKGYFCGSLRSYVHPMLFSQSLTGYPNIGEVVVAYVKLSHSSSETEPRLLTRYKDGEWLDKSTGEIISKTDVIGWLPVPTLSDKTIQNGKE